MTVFVDDMTADFGRMKMCHMIADSHDELVAMADRIGVARRWLQKAGTYREHFDICLSKRALAVKAGAVEITWGELGRKVVARKTGAQPPATFRLRARVHLCRNDTGTDNRGYVK